MKVEELRIGNLIFYHSNFTKETRVKVVDLITFSLLLGSHEEFKESYLPIPLTEEWLLKFEFWTSDWDVHSTLRKQVLDSSLVYDKDNKTFDLGDLLNIKIEYVHQLQNLYFVLTGEELKLK